MESTDKYFERKDQEIHLLNSALRAPLKLRRAKSVHEIVEQKFQLAAALKAEHALADWSHTETDWVHARQPRSGPFKFEYDYQRADLEVRGPSFYPHNFPSETVYTSSGMAAISALLMAIRPVFSQADILLPLTAYGETLELVVNHAPHLRPCCVGSASFTTLTHDSRCRILLLDSSTSATVFAACLEMIGARPDLVVFDTTCFSTGSGRIRQAVHLARLNSVPIVLIRSHTKLDSLGIEYGRLGSAAFVTDVVKHQPVLFEQMSRLVAQMREAVRLFGGAALPAHFPPFVERSGYRSLTSKRMAAILRNSRQIARRFSTLPQAFSAELRFAHGLYVTLNPARALDENETREVIGRLCADLSRCDLPLSHAGSFGFDFAGAEWALDKSLNRYVVRIAVPDLPATIWDDVVDAIVVWWTKYHAQRSEHPARMRTR